MKRLLLLLVLVPVLLSAETPADQSSIQFTLAGATATYTISLGGGATQLSNTVQPNAQLLGLAKDLANLASGAATGVNADGSLNMVATGTTPSPNPALVFLLNKYVTKITTADGSALFSH
jgi:hypothetical protein